MSDDEQNTVQIWIAHSTKVATDTTYAAANQPKQLQSVMIHKPIRSAEPKG